MQFITALFGGSENTLLNAAFSLGIVLVLVLLGLWAMKFLLQASSSMSRGRSRRLQVVETLQLDSRRKVTILRRDGVEHVILTGGAQDLVLEAGVPVELATRRPQPRAAATPAPEPKTPATPEEPAIVTAAGDRRREMPHLPLTRQNALLRRSLLRSAARDPLVIPAKGYNSDAAATDSATTGPVNQTNGQSKLGAAPSSRFPSSPPKA
jgi:flagellar protein FliO/FliZ